MKEKLQYLSGRILLLLLAGELGLVLLCGYSLILTQRIGDSWWPMGMGLILLGMLNFMGYVWIIRPYRQSEKMLELFLDGYSMQSLTEGAVNLTPVLHQAANQIGRILQSDKMLNLNKRQAQYLALQNQINPHFLYNTLESIRGEALIAGLDTVADMTEALASFFRYTISKVENLVSVEDELQNSLTYFKIQQYRFGDRLQLHILCDEDEKEEIYRCRLPKLTLQPLLENSIIHGTECKIGQGNTTIRLQLTEKRLLIDVSDDGVGMGEATLAKLNRRLEQSDLIFSAGPEQESHGGIALVNVDNRIHLLFGEEYGMHVYSTEGVGTDVCITLPAITSDREVRGSGAML